MHREEFLNTLCPTNDDSAKEEARLKTLRQKSGEDLCYVGFHLIYTSTFRIDSVQSESEVLVEVVKVEHAVRMLH